MNTQSSAWRSRAPLVDNRVCIQCDCFPMAALPNAGRANLIVARKSILIQFACMSSMTVNNKNTNHSSLQSLDEYVESAIPLAEFEQHYHLSRPSN